MRATIITLPDEMYCRLANLCAATGRTENSIMLEALNEQLGDIEDVLIAEQRLADLRAGRTHALSSDEVEKMLNKDSTQ